MKLNARYGKIETRVTSADGSAVRMAAEPGGDKPERDGKWRSGYRLAGPAGAEPRSGIISRQ